MKRQSGGEDGHLDLSRSTNDDTLPQGQRDTDADGGTHGGFNRDSNDYGYAKGKRDAQGYKGPRDSYFGYYSDGGSLDGAGASSGESLKNPLDDLVKGPLKSGEFNQPRFRDFAGGRSAPRVGVPRDNKASQ